VRGGPGAAHAGPVRCTGDRTPCARGRVPPAHGPGAARELMRQTVAMPNRRPALELISPTASPAEAAAIMAALERFMRDTAPPRTPRTQARDPWTRAAMLEGVGREDDRPSAWGDPHPWI
jgi:hypothetical protein